MNFYKLVFPGIAMIATIYGLGRFSFGLFLPDISKDLHLSASSAGIISSLFYLSYCFTIIYATLRTAKTGPKYMIMLASLLVILGLITISIASNALSLSLGVIFAGASSGLISPPYGYAISLWIKWEQQGKANTWINSGTSIGLVFTGITAMLVFIDWRSVYLIYGIIAILITVWNFFIIPSLKHNININPGSLNILDISASKRIIFASTILGISTAPYWTFSKSYVQNTDHYSPIALSIFWILIGVAGVLGGISGRMIDQYGLKFSYFLGVILMAAASILLALTPFIWIVPFLASLLFGASYIFITGVLLVWGVKLFVKNASLGIGIPFLMLAVGQVIGSVLAGPIVEELGYTFTFVIYGIIGLTPILIYPKVEVKPPKINIDDEYTKLQKANKDLL
ncbi:putative MFS family arabinose efflux permease [Staphylococcus pasteuri]|uniref:Predicted arabinose efflux permease, MFS family n=2 Tax=Staphylococcus TaxID=1279 RepID=A0ABY1H7E4_9STAP|nr:MULTISPECIES: MFS transporter [Staphylococcus]ATH61682.1 MFS transporter [Staphylococcus pasteuri]KKI55963.1 Sugar efflux permease [Staphylococcus pasteuri]MCF7599836.1 MFS transporter [Staphylococcus pasteuri]MDI3232291.1 MFS transporter [Staphylococcus pasteuri]MDO6572824.1 MFS transporter [Staphylococcus pasteuri_A]